MITQFRNDEGVHPSKSRRDFMYYRLRGLFGTGRPFSTLGDLISTKISRQELTYTTINLVKCDTITSLGVFRKWLKNRSLSAAVDDLDLCLDLSLGP